MVQSFDEFCDHFPIWDSNLLLNSSYPHFTNCFQDTLLIWIPCGIIWLISPFYIRFLVSGDAQPLPFSCLNISKSFIPLLLAFVSAINLVYAGEKENSGRYNSTAFYLAESIKVATFLLTLLLLQLERRKGVITSGPLFVFWLLTSVAAVIPFYTKIEENEYDDRRFMFTLYCVYFALVWAELVLISVVDNHQRQGYQPIGKPECPEVKASFPSRLTFEWITSLVVKIYRSGIKDDELWELHPRDQSETFIPDVQRTWQEELTKFRKAEYV